MRTGFVDQLKNQLPHATRSSTSWGALTDKIAEGAHQHPQEPGLLLWPQCPRYGLQSGLSAPRQRTNDLLQSGDQQRIQLLDQRKNALQRLAFFIERPRTLRESVTGA